jgi:thiamine-monophosphate kinase
MLENNFKQQPRAVTNRWRPPVNPASHDFWLGLHILPDEQGNIAAGARRVKFYRAKTKFENTTDPFGDLIVLRATILFNPPMPGEFDFLNWLSSQQTPDKLVSLGIGDDLAALHWPKDDLLLVGADQVLDGVHFDSSIHSPRDIGRKAMNRNLSDCAAMACVPAAALTTLALPGGAGEEYAKELFLGMKDAGDLHDCPIVGGDTASWAGKLVVTVTILGRSNGITPVTRSGAKAGDLIYVTGPLGASILGRHMTFQPRVKLARFLAGNYSLHAMADISDGLGRDLRNICMAGGVGAALDARSIPIHPDVGRLTDAKDPMIHALTDGEDYELLIVSPDALPEPCVKIGWIENRSGLRLDTGAAEMAMDWSQIGGWEHSI